MTLEEKKTEINAKADALTQALNTKVHAFVFKGDKSEDDFVVGYIKEPPRLVKQRAMDKTLMGQGFSVGAEIIQACILKEETDPRILSELSENDRYALGAENFATELVSVSLDQLKKK
jgi:hypothetical protein